MKLLHRQPHKKRGRNLGLEMLEERQLSERRPGQHFRIMSGSCQPGKAGFLGAFIISPNDFTAGRGNKILMGIDVAADPGTSVQPGRFRENAQGRPGAAHSLGLHARAVIKAQKLTDPVSWAVLVFVPVPRPDQPAAHYDVQVRGANKTTGNYLLGFYLPGDVAGAGTVTQPISRP